MGTRGSALALAQSSWAARQLEKAHPGLKVESVVITTSGDRFGAPPPEIARTLPQGAKGLWVKEIEEALLSGSIDFAVHSAKDLPAETLPGLLIAAYPEREDARDVLIGRGGAAFAALKPGARVGTSSLRRQLLLDAAKPGLSFSAVRGNVDTRLKKLADGQFDALVLAAAGLKRLGRADVPHEALDPSMLIPSPGQGALGLEVKEGRGDIVSLVAALDHRATRLCVELERAFLAAVGGGCGSPVAGHATLEGGELRFAGFLAPEGARKGTRVAGRCAPEASRAFASDMARQARGG